MNIIRRNFLKISAIVSFFFANGHFPLSGKPKRRRRGRIKEHIGIRNIFTKPPDIEPITGWLDSFSPVKNKKHDKNNYTLLYDIIKWVQIPNNSIKPKNKVIGSLSIKRKQNKDLSLYTINQEMTIGKVNNIIKAEIICNNEYDTPLSWTLHTYYKNGKIVKRSEMKEKGSFKNQIVTLEDGSYKTKWNSKLPVHSQWTILHCIANNKIKNKDSFNYLQDLSLFKENHIIKNRGTVELPVANQNTISLQSYSHTGNGILPIHYLVDKTGNVQIITNSFLNYSLKKIT